MPMTPAEWKTWSAEKRQFFAELFTCYKIAPDGELCIDAARRQQLVRQQLSKQTRSRNAELVINSTTLVNYILVGDLLLKDDKVKRVEDDISVLYLQRTPLIISSSGVNVRNTKLPVQNTFVGGFRAPNQEISEHFARVIKQKMSNDAGAAANTIAKRATCVPLGVFDDLTVLSRCALDKEEGLFLVEGPEFKTAIEKQARYLLDAAKLTLSVERLSEQIASHMMAYSDKTSEKVSLLSLSVSSVNTYAAFYPERFSQIRTYAKDIETEKIESGKEAWRFKPGVAGLVDCLIKGPLEFAFQSEYVMLVKLAWLLKSFAGKSFAEMIENFHNPIATLEVSVLPEMFGRIAEAQIANITKLVLPPPPFFMGTIWKFDRPANFILDILKTMHCFDLYSIAHMAGFSQEAAHLAYGCDSQELLAKLNQGVSLMWTKNSQVLLEAIQQFLEQQCAQEQVLKPAGADLDSKPIPAASAPPKGPGVLGVFKHTTAARDLQEANSVGETAKKT